MKSLGVLVYLHITIVFHCTTLSSLIQPSHASLNRPDSSLLFTTTKTTSHKETDIHHNQSTSSQNEIKEREKYSSLPHTIFSSNGRLYNVEKAALLACNENDITSSLVLAIKFGGGGDDDDDGKSNNDSSRSSEHEESSILILSSSPVSPYLPSPVRYHDEGNDNTSKNDDNKEHNDFNDDKDTNDNEKHIPLWQYNIYNHQNIKQTKVQQLQQNMITPSFPLSILSSNLLIGTGGTSIDSIILHDKILELYLSFVKVMDGLRSSTHRVEGKVTSSFLARKIADSLQVYTQNVSSGYGRVLSSSALVIGMNESFPTQRGKDMSNIIWRIDPTGQFWNCHAAAVGRGAGIVEGEMMKLVYQWKRDKNQKCVVEGDVLKRHNDDNNDVDMDRIIESISNYDVEQCFTSLTFDKVIKFACDCIQVALRKSIKNSNGDMIGIQGILITNDSEEKVARMEMVHPSIIEECLKTLVT